MVERHSMLMSYWVQSDRNVCLRRSRTLSCPLFGDRDEWATIPMNTHHTRAEAEALFQLFEIERFDEVEQDGETAVGKQKYWHLFHIVARKH